MKLTRRLQRNHALEHATVHLLSQMQPGVSLVGRTDAEGFWLYGDLDQNSIARAVREGLRLLRSGRSGLAVHPRCGTNMAVAILLGGGVAALLRGRRGRMGLGRLLMAGAALAGAMAYSQPLGMWVQRRLTTTADVGEATITGVRRQDMAGIVAHHVLVGHED